MRVLHVNKFHYIRGGAETVYFALTDLLQLHGHEVIPFAMQDDRNLPTPYSKYFVSNIELREESGGLLGRAGAAARILYSREAEQKIDRLIRDTRPDIAHLHNVYHQLSPSILRALKRHGIPVVMTLHDYKLICPAYTLYTDGAPCNRCRGHRYFNAVIHSCVKDSRLKSAICATEAYAHAATGIYRSNVNFYVAPSQFMARKVVEFGLNPDQVVYIPNFIDAGRFGAASAVGEYMLFAGRLESVKGVKTLLRAVSSSAVARSTPLRIAGDGEQRGELEAFCASEGLTNVQFLGHRSPADVAELLANAAFAVVPSEWYENAPLSVMEAAAHGKAVIVSDMGGIPELVKPGVSGITFPAGDAQALASAIEAMLADPDKTAEMGRQGRAFIEEKFSPESHYQQMVALYERALSNGTSVV
jgi:glycosyltransferase involved in cell wall biosynthesis